MEIKGGLLAQTGPIPEEKVSLIGSWQGPLVYRCHTDAWYICEDWRG